MLVQDTELQHQRQTSYRGDSGDASGAEGRRRGGPEKAKNSLNPSRLNYRGFRQTSNSGHLDPECHHATPVPCHRVNKIS